MLTLISLLLPLYSHAALTQWSGKGSCYLSHAWSASSACDYYSWITREENSLTVTNCIMWKQEWGEGWECPKSVYEIRNGNELWLNTQKDIIRVGSISEKEIQIQYNYQGVVSHELYQFNESELKYSWDYVTEGKAWNYLATLALIQR